MQLTMFSPLTPALSPLRGEGEALVKFDLLYSDSIVDDHDPNVDRPEISPLPFLKGEGRGEGLLDPRTCETKNATNTNA